MSWPTYKKRLRTYVMYSVHDLPIQSQIIYGPSERQRQQGITEFQGFGMGYSGMYGDGNRGMYGLGHCGSGPGVDSAPPFDVAQFHGEGFMDVVRGIFRAGKKAAKVAKKVAQSDAVKKAVKVGKKAVEIGSKAAEIYSSPEATAIRNLLPSSDETAAPAFPGEKHALLRLANGKMGTANFMGPGTEVLKRIERGDKPRTASDEVAMMHDVKYRLAQGLGNREMQVEAQREADKRMVDSLNYLSQSKGDDPFNIAQGQLITAKMLGEDIGALRKGTFGGPLEDLSEKERDVLTAKAEELSQKGLGHPALKLKLKMAEKYKGKGLRLAGQKGGDKTYLRALMRLIEEDTKLIEDSEKRLEEARTHGEFLSGVTQDEDLSAAHYLLIMEIVATIDQAKRRLSEAKDLLKKAGAKAPVKPKLSTIVAMYKARIFRLESLNRRMTNMIRFLRDEGIDEGLSELEMAVEENEAKIDKGIAALMKIDPEYMARKSKRKLQFPEEYEGKEGKDDDDGKRRKGNGLRLAGGAKKKKKGRAPKPTRAKPIEELLPSLEEMEQIDNMILSVEARLSEMEAFASPGSSKEAMAIDNLDTSEAALAVQTDRLNRLYEAYRSKSGITSAMRKSLKKQIKARERAYAAAKEQVKVDKKVLEMIQEMPAPKRRRTRPFGKRVVLDMDLGLPSVQGESKEEGVLIESKDPDDFESVAATAASQFPSLPLTDRAKQARARRMAIRRKERAKERAEEKELDEAAEALAKLPRKRKKEVIDLTMDDTDSEEEIEGFKITASAEDEDARAASNLMALAKGDGLRLAGGMKRKILDAPKKELTDEDKARIEALEAEIAELEMKRRFLENEVNAIHAKVMRMERRGATVVSSMTLSSLIATKNKRIKKLRNLMSALRKAEEEIKSIKRRSRGPKDTSTKRRLDMDETKGEGLRLAGQKGGFISLIIAGIAAASAAIAKAAAVAAPVIAAAVPVIKTTAGVVSAAAGAATAVKELVGDGMTQKQLAGKIKQVAKSTKVTAKDLPQGMLKKLEKEAKAIQALDISKAEKKKLMVKTVVKPLVPEVRKKFVSKMAKELKGDGLRLAGQRGKGLKLAGQRGKGLDKTMDDAAVQAVAKKI